MQTSNDTTAHAGSALGPSHEAELVSVSALHWKARCGCGWASPEVPTPGEARKARDDHERTAPPRPRRQTLHEAVTAVVDELEHGPDVELTGQWLTPVITRALDPSAPTVLAGPDGGRDWWLGVVEDHLVPRLEAGMSWDAALAALRRARDEVTP